MSPQGQTDGRVPDWSVPVASPVLDVRVVLDLRLMPPMAMALQGCEALWVEDIWAGRRHVHREAL